MSMSEREIPPSDEGEGDFLIRNYRHGDELKLREVCVRTGKSGKDASDWIPGGLLPDIYLSLFALRPRSRQRG